MKESEIIKKYLSDRGRKAATARWAKATDRQKLLVGRKLKKARAEKRLNKVK